MKAPIRYVFDLNAKSKPRVLCVTHTDDKQVDFIELSVVQGNTHPDLTGATITARMVMVRTHELLSDAVACTLTNDGHVKIPIDNSVVPLREGEMLVEVNIVLGEKILTLQFPLLVRVNGSILDDAEITPESQGTIPKLLKDAADALEEATQALEQAGDYDSLEHKPQINGNTLSGNKTSDELGLQNKLTAGENVNIDANGNITITGVTKYRNVPTEQVDDCIENGVLYSLYISGLSNAQIIAHNNYTTITQHALLDDGRLMYRMRQGETPWQPAGEWSAWESIGGSQIVSGVVNQNGTITFTNSDGTTFTTTGASVIGDDGFSPTATVTQTASGATVSITDKNGTTTANISNGADGQDYVLTAQDKSDIADIVLSELPTTEGVLYGN
ncbi:MAG: hypothetical protein II190_04235 [Ruminococcus sp.]|nr:hypothetical protein [Ruminococcus sp.]